MIAETQNIGKCKISIEGYHINAEANKNTKSGGILIATRKDAEIETTIQKKDIKNQHIWAILRTKNFSFRVCLVYGYACEARIPEEDQEEWYIQLEQEYLKHMEYETLIIGDFNAHTGTDDLQVNYNGRSLNSLIERRDLINLNNEEFCQGKYTREDTNGTKTIIDYAIADASLTSKVTKMIIDDRHKYKLYGYRKIHNKNKETPTDHNSIIIDLKIPIEKKNERITIWNLNNKESLEKFKQNTEHIKMKSTWDTEANIDEQYNKWDKQLKSMMYKSFKRVTIKNRITNKEIKEIITIKRKLNQQIAQIQKLDLQSNIVLDYLKMKKGELLEEITNRINQERARKNKIKVDKMSKKEIKDGLWQIRKNNMSKGDIKHTVKDKDGNTLTKKEDILSRYQQYYEDLLKNRAIPDKYEPHSTLISEIFEHRMKTSEYDHLEINKEFTMVEMNKVLRSMKAGKAPGPDNITYEIIQHAGTNLKNNILKMINYFWTKEDIPSKLQCLYIKSMYKGKGNMDELENQRGLFLSSIIIKFYEKLIMQRMYPETESHGFSKFQLGGRKNMSPTDQVFVLRAIQEHMIYMGKIYFIEFCDLKKAFDKMILTHVMNDIWDANIRGRIWRNIFKINEKTNIIIKTPYGNTDKVNAQQILKQGSVLASTMAALHTDSSNKLIHNQLGTWYGEIKINNILFQDDIARIETSAKNLNAANKIFEVFQDLNGMLFHETKTVFISNSKNSKISINNANISQKNAAKYLGDIISDDGKYDQTIEERKLNINGIIAEIKSIMYQAEEDLEITAAKQYHEGIIVTKLLYNSETWTNLTKTNIEQLEKIQNNSLKRLLRIPYSTPSLGLLYELQIPTIQSTIEKRKLMYYHKILNQKETLAKQILIQQKNLHSNHFMKEIDGLLLKYQLEKYNENLTEISKSQWKKIVTKATHEIDQQKMKTWCLDSSKCKNLITQEGTSEYLRTIPSRAAKVLLIERLNMTDVKINYKGNYKNINCSICTNKEETTLHLLEYHQKGKNMKEIIEIYNQFKNNLNVPALKLEQLAKTITSSIDNRDKLLSNRATGSSIDEVTL